MTAYRPGVEEISVGDHDVVSRAAYHARISLCGLPGEAATCTRAAGHGESQPGHPSTAHVAADIAARTFVALEVWL